MVASPPAASAGTPSRTSGRSVPTRTCIGCRRTSPATALLRVVATPEAAGPVPVVPDARRRLPGRGAWVHLDPGCVSLAQRRRAFARALRVPDADPAPVIEYMTQVASQ